MHVSISEEKTLLLLRTPYECWYFKQECLVPGWTGLDKFGKRRFLLQTNGACTRSRSIWAQTGSGRSSSVGFDALEPMIIYKWKKQRLCFGKSFISYIKPGIGQMSSFLQGLCCCRQIFEAEVCRFAKRGCKQGDHSLAGRVCGELFVSKATFLAYFLQALQGVCLIYVWGTAIWLEGRESSPARRKRSKGWQRRMHQVPEIPFNSILLRQIYLQIWNLERQLSLSRHFLTSLGIILIIEPFKHVRQKWIKLNSLLELPEASRLRNAFL